MASQMEKVPPLDPVATRSERQRAADLDRHARKCAICNHPERVAIEDDFVRWCDPQDIKSEYRLPSRSSLYRHAEATGLLERRRRNLRGVAERILESVDCTEFSGGTILRAMRLFAHIAEDGQWLEPPKRAVVTHIHTFAAPADAPQPLPAQLPANQPVLSGAKEAEPRAASAPPRRQFLIGTQKSSGETSND